MGMKQLLTMQEKRALAAKIRNACLQAALDAYEQGGLAGMCEEGRWELAVDALRELNVDALVDDDTDAPTKINTAP
jgi:hypothetical protein